MGSAGASSVSERFALRSRKGRLDRVLWLHLGSAREHKGFAGGERCTLGAAPSGPVTARLLPRAGDWKSSRDTAGIRDVPRSEPRGGGDAGEGPPGSAGGSAVLGRVGLPALLLLPVCILQAHSDVR